ncbi:DUF2975 domain-containing protein [Niallia taxi]|uniref:DUF2975 domain-containing protein n=1 Tax=Niallia taxi TaxID=2499688 RepID=UPI0011A5979C|nr:DUF2975 domain-containing protein [Niallia taxi]MCT2346320.1 DUF2975 domain-containing protein [Niallia taxi]MDE5051677.1 DUF2975 domain-containing protein [Niallia taxi]MED3964947.1 DUF2975 domain-containing protein [Niallia taxi]WOD61901.1 DUF2975 domain-containing protein [Niallia taxi]
MLKRGSTTFLKLAVFLIGLPILALGVFGIFYLTKNPANPDYAHLLYPMVIIMYISAAPFFHALVQAFRLLSFIDKNHAFSQDSVRALKVIKYCAVIISGLYAIMLPFVYFVAQLDDAPGLVIIGMVPIFASIVIAVFAAVLQKLLKDAIDLKDENEHTI